MPPKMSFFRSTIFFFFLFNFIDGLWSLHCFAGDIVSLFHFITILSLTTTSSIRFRATKEKGLKYKRWWAIHFWKDRKMKPKRTISWMCSSSTRACVCVRSVVESVLSERIAFAHRPTSLSDHSKSYSASIRIEMRRRERGNPIGGKSSSFCHLFRLCDRWSNAIISLVSNSNGSTFAYFMSHSDLMKATQKNVLFRFRFISADLRPQSHFVTNWLASTEKLYFCSFPFVVQKIVSIFVCFFLFYFDCPCV